VINVGGVGTMKFKGHRQRSDQSIGGNPQSLVIDIDGRRFIDINDKKKTATITPLDSIKDELDKIGVGAIKSSLTKTGQTKKLLGYNCAVHDFRVEMPFNIAGGTDPAMSVNMVLTGTACLSTEVPGLKDYQAFYQASADSGFIFGDPRAVKAPSGAAQAKAYADLTRKMAAAGIALESHILITANGDNPMSAMMAKLAASDITTTVTQIETGDTDAALYDVPAGYKTKTQK
jgi:hypothetical protein